jgi:hypothetical protein
LGKLGDSDHGDNSDEDHNKDQFNQAESCAVEDTEYKSLHGSPRGKKMNETKARRVPHGKVMKDEANYREISVLANLDKMESLKRGGRNRAGLPRELHNC